MPYAQMSHVWVTAIHVGIPESTGISEDCREAKLHFDACDVMLG